MSEYIGSLLAIFAELALRWINALIQKVEDDPRFSSQEHRNEVIDTFERA